MQVTGVSEACQAGARAQRAKKKAGARASRAASRRAHTWACAAAASGEAWLGAFSALIQAAFFVVDDVGARANVE